MTPNIVVLTDFSLAAERARAYAAVLAAPIKAELHLVHVFLPQPVVTEYGVVVPVLDENYVPDTRRSLQQVAEALPVPATAEVLEADWFGAVTDTLQQYRPLLVVAGLSATTNFLDEWFSNRAVSLPHHCGCPLLLVPEHLPDAALHLPRRLALAVEDRPFQLAPAAGRVATLLDGLQLDAVAVTVLPEEERTAGWDGLRSAQQCGLAACMPGAGLHKVVGDQPGSGILKAATDLEADLLALLDQGHGWVHRVFQGSVISYVLRHTAVPVLLLPAHVPSPTPAALGN